VLSTLLLPLGLDRVALFVNDEVVELVLLGITFSVFAERLARRCLASFASLLMSEKEKTVRSLFVKPWTRKIQSLVENYEEMLVSRGR
jgi:hypothetical protein